MSESTAYEYLTRLNYFKNCISNKSDLTAGSLIKINKNAYDPYYVSEYSSFLRNNSSISTLVLKQRVVILKNFLPTGQKDCYSQQPNIFLIKLTILMLLL